MKEKEKMYPVSLLENERCIHLATGKAYEFFVRF